MTDVTVEHAPTSDIIDATQNAVIEVVTNVSEMIEKTSADSTFSDTHHHEPFYLSAEFWVGMAFVLVVIFAFRPVLAFIKRGLINRRQRIISELEGAATLKSDAQVLLAKYERRFLNTQKEVEDIANRASEELARYLKTQKEMLESDLQKKQNEAQKHIDAEIAKTIGDLNTHITAKTIEILTHHLKDDLTDAQKSKLIDTSIKNILQKL